MNSDDLLLYLYEIEKLMLLIQENIRQKTNLSPMEAKLLNQMRKNNKVGHASDLAKRNNVTTAAIMHCLYDLEANGLVIKSVNETDNRRKTYTLTETGLKQATLVAKSFKEGLSNYLDSLGEDKEAFARILKKTINFLEEKKNA